MFVWYAVSCVSNNGHQQDMCMKIDWAACSKYVNHSRFNNQHNWWDILYMTTLINVKIFTI